VRRPRVCGGARAELEGADERTRGERGSMAVTTGCAAWKVRRGRVLYVGGCLGCELGQENAGCAGDATTVAVHTMAPFH